MYGPGAGRAHRNTSEARKPTAAASTFSRPSRWEPGRTASRPAASAGTPSAPKRARSPMGLVAPEAVERVHVDRVEALADAEDKDAEDDEGDQDREGERELDDQRHALGPGRGQDQAVLEAHEPDDLAHRVAAGDHHQQAEQDHGEREGDVLARQRVGRG